MIPVVPLLGLDFADLTVAEAAKAIAARPPDAPFRYVVTPNADHLVRLSRDPSLVPIWRDAWLRLLDSRVIARLGRLSGIAVPAVATGSDLTALLLKQHVHRGEKIAIIGLQPAWLSALVAQYGLAPPFHYDPPMGFDRCPTAFARTVRFILDHPARLLFLAVGSPRQERLAAMVAASGRATGTALCVGASLVFLAGAERRAPVWMQRLALEWAFRLAKNPGRMARRYLVDSPRILPLLLRERGRSTMTAAVTDPSAPTQDVPAP